MSFIPFRKNVVLIPTFIVVVFVFVSVFVSALFSILWSFKLNQDFGRPKEDYSYKFTNYDPKTSESSVGLISSVSRIESSEISFFSSDDGKISLLSDFAKPVYKCTGTCVCEEGIRERRNAMTISRGIVYMISALTSVIAISKSKEYFRKECENELRNDCESSSIMSEVSSCVDMSYEEYQQQEEVDDGHVMEDGLKIYRTKDGECFKKFNCFGKCKGNRNLKQPSFIDQLSDKFQSLKTKVKRKGKGKEIDAIDYEALDEYCESFELKRTVIVPCLPGEQQWEEIDTIERLTILAETEMYEQYYKYFCPEVGKVLSNKKLCQSAKPRWMYKIGGNSAVNTPEDKTRLISMFWLQCFNDGPFKPMIDKSMEHLNKNI